MRLIKFRHACVRLEATGAALVIDPGAWPETVAALDGADAVLITHEHADHVDAGALKAAVEANPALAVFAHQEVLESIGHLGPTARPVQSGATFTAAGFEVTAVGTRHAHVYGDVPDIPNLGYVVAPGLYHPGDAFYVPGLPVQTLLVPISAPWLKVGEAIDFVQAVAPRRAYPIHDGILNEVGQALTDRWLQQLSGTDYSRLPLGEPVDL